MLCYGAAPSKTKNHPFLPNPAAEHNFFPAKPSLLSSDRKLPELFSNLYMKISFPALLLFCSTAGFAQTEANIRDLKAGKVQPDTSYVYSLPFAKGKKFLLVQAYMSGFSHKGEIALDFKMKKGTRICAARSGVVVASRDYSDKGGLKQEMLSEGNFIIIQHSDGTRAHYWHLKKNGALVNPGDTVQLGQVIGLSGNTGYSAFAHLHFEVVDPARGQIPTRFRTKKGIKYLRPGKWHKAV